jgi:hypothetical protein
MRSRGKCSGSGRSLSRSGLPSFPTPSWFVGLSLWCLGRLWSRNIRFMRRRAYMRHRLCMRTLVWVGVADGPIDVTSMAVGKSG